jgi:hypothetical protein
MLLQKGGDEMSELQTFGVGEHVIIKNILPTSAHFNDRKYYIGKEVIITEVCDHREEDLCPQVLCIYFVFPEETKEENVRNCIYGVELEKIEKREKVIDELKLTDVYDTIQELSIEDIQNEKKA